MNFARSRQRLTLLQSEASRAGGREICGLLLGREGVVEEVVPIANAAPDPERSFLLDPAEHLRTSRMAREAGKAVLGHYHSHPGGSAQPSPTDAEAAVEEGIYWLILGRDEARLWISRRGGSVLGAFEPAEFEFVLQAPGAAANRVSHAKGAPTA